MNTCEECKKSTSGYCNKHMPNQLSVMKEEQTTKWELFTQFGRDMHTGAFTEAICEHGIGHHKGIHGCDGCCATWPKEISDNVSED